ncbi:glycosyltransferase [Azospirillum sp.]|uniref:glycosyltransferase n=1 Tax=Azospirillum sp. TaxID=34012 RepID=UPI003D70C200
MARLLLINYEYPPLGGGAANATANTARELARMGVAVCVVTSAFAGLPARETTADGVVIRRIPTLRRRRDRSSVVEMLAFLASSLLFTPAIARRWRPDATIAYFGLPCGPAAWLIRVLCGVPYAVSLRGGDVPGFLYDGISLYHRLAAPVIGALWRRAAAVVANSDGLAALARRFAPDVGVRVVPNGVDTGLFRPAEAPEAERKDGRLRLLIVGRLVRQKGVDCILEAMARLDAPVSLRVVGDGGAREELERQAAALGLSGRVAFVGWAAREELPAAYRAADAFVFPSRDEGMPNVVLEAMASGLPVIATDIAGNRELVVDGETGVLLATDDVPALAAAIARLAADPELCRRFGAAGRRRVVDHYSWAAVAAAYRDLVPGTRSHARVDGAASYAAGAAEDRRP